MANLVTKTTTIATRDMLDELKVLNMLVEGQYDKAIYYLYLYHITKNVKRETYVKKIKNKVSYIFKLKRNKKQVSFTYRPNDNNCGLGIFSKQDAYNVKTIDILHYLYNKDLSKLRKIFSFVETERLAKCFNIYYELKYEN